MGKCSDVIRKKRGRIYERDNYTCVFCGQKFEVKDLTIDHIMPLSRGGNNQDYNLVTSCQKCNVKKGNKIFNKEIEGQLKSLDYEILKRKKKIVFNLITNYVENGILQFNNIG